MSAPVHAGIHPPADTPLGRHPLDRHPPGQTPPPPADGYCCGRYASYWNAFLLQNYCNFWQIIMFWSQPGKKMCTSQRKRRRRRNAVHVKKRGKYSCKSINVETNIQKQMQHHTKALTTCSTVSQTLLRHNEI